MTTKSNQKDYKAMYLAQKKEADLLRKNLQELKEEAIQMKEEAICVSRFVKEKLKEKDAEIEKYKKAEKSYNEKFGLEETRLTSQEMKETERRAREDEEDEDEENDEVGNGLYGYCNECKICMTEDDDDRKTGFCEGCDIEKGHWGYCKKCKSCLTEDDEYRGFGQCDECDEEESDNTSLPPLLSDSDSDSDLDSDSDSDSDSTDDSTFQKCEFCSRVTDQTTPNCATCDGVMCDKCGFPNNSDSEEDDEDEPWFCPDHYIGKIDARKIDSDSD